jgi:hypothetical protein
VERSSKLLPYRYHPVSKLGKSLTMQTMADYPLSTAHSEPTGRLG